MGVDIDFHYHPHPADAASAEVEAASSEYYISLFDCDAEFLQAAGLWPSFIAEYRASHSPIQEWAREMDEEEIEEFFDDMEPPDWENLDWEESWESSPFDPAEAEDWAERWISAIEVLEDEALPVLFPYELNLQTMQSRFDRNYTIKELQKVVAQAGCAQRHGLQLTVLMVWG